jgi:hypothetical protein
MDQSVIQPTVAASLSLDVSLEKARALHRVWRALNDGDCPKCHAHVAATDVIRHSGLHIREIEFNQSIECPMCHFSVSGDEISDIEKMFAPAMDAAVKIFEDWQIERMRKLAEQGY